MSARPTRPPVPPLPAFDALDQAHAKILTELKQFESLLSHVTEQGLDAKAQRIAASICRFFAGDARQHHADEERLVFPGLLNGNDAALIEQVHRLQQDHGWLEEDWRVMQPQVQSIADGIGGFDLEMMRHALPIYSQLYRDHIALEESMVYPASRKLQASLVDGIRERTSTEEPPKGG